MKTWFDFYKRGMSQPMPEDPIGDKQKLSLPPGPVPSTRQRLKNLLPFVKRHWRKGMIGALLILFTSLLGFPGPLITRYVVDKVIIDKQLALLSGAIILLAAIKITGMLAGAMQKYYFSRFEQEVLLDIQQHLLDRTLRFPKSFFDSQEVGYLMSRLLNDVGGLRMFFSSTLVYIFSSFFRFLGGVGLLFYLRWQLALVVCGALPVMVLIVRFFAKKIHVLSHRGMEQRGKVSKKMQETLSNPILVKAFSKEKKTVAGVMKELRGSFQVAMERLTVNSAADLAISILPELSRLLVLGAGAYWVIRGEWTLGSLLAFQSYVGYVYGPARFLATANLSMQNAFASLGRVSALFEIVPEDEEGKGKIVTSLNGEVEFSHVSFSYSGDEMILEDVSFVARPGDWIAVVGPSGVGKTTLISLIMGFYKPKSGEILFDRLPQTEYRLSSLRERIGYVSQKSQLLSGTIMENVCYGNPGASREQVIKVAEAAGIHNFILNLPGGYEEMLGEGGVNLSEGQRQRLSLARALLKDPDILVLDEPASALDNLVENSIFQALPPLVRDKTLFVVAHRRSTIEQAKRILLLNEKRLVAVGEHRDLMAQNDYYRSLVTGIIQKEEYAG